MAAHDVRLPDEFVAHVESSSEALHARRRPKFDHLGQRRRGGGYDDEYEAWMTATADRLRLGQSLDHLGANWLNADLTDEWWLAQVGWTPEQTA